MTIKVRIMWTLTSNISKTDWPILVIFAYVAKLCFFIAFRFPQAHQLHKTRPRSRKRFVYLSQKAARFRVVLICNCQFYFVTVKFYVDVS